MLKKIFSLFFALLFCSATVLVPIKASAFEVTGFDITAKAGLLASMDTGEFLYENNIDKKMYPASITKIMTAVLILESEKFKPDKKISMTKEALDLVLGTGSSVSLFEEGETFTQLDLLYMVLMSSYGDCTYLAAEYYGGSVENFVDMMNQKAKELGLKNTHYSNPVGLHDENNYTTVRDTYTLTLYALQNETFKTVCESHRYSFEASISGKRNLATTNFLQDSNTNYYYPYAHGVKTGFTDEAGRCLVSTASFNGYNYICILMKCPNEVGKRHEFIESAELYRWAFKDFSFKEIATSDQPVCEMPIELSLETDFVPLFFKEPFVSVLPNAADDSTIVIKPHLNSESIEAPIKKGEVLGYAEVMYAEKLIGKVDLVAGNDVEQSKILLILKYIKEFFTSVYMKIFIIVIIAIILIFILLCIRLNYSKIKRRKVKYIPYKGEKNHEK